MELITDDIYKQLFLTAGEGLIVTDQAGTIIIANPRITQIFGYETDELIGEKVEILIPKAVHARHRKHRNEYVAHPEQRSMGIGLDLKGLRKDGSEIAVELSLNHFNVDGQMYVMALLTDITLRKSAEQELHTLKNQLEERVEERTRELVASQELYRVIARNFPNGTINVLDNNLNYVFVEGKELNKIAVTPESMIGTAYTKKFESGKAEKVERHLENVLSGISVSFDARIDNKEYILNAVPLKSKLGKRVLVVEQNITEQKRVEEQIRHALESEKNLNELKSRFVSMASHEFRTPLGTILSSISLLAKYQGADQQPKREKHIQRIKSSVSNLTGILNDFLSIDKLEEGKVQSTPLTCDITKLCDEIIDQMNDMALKGQKIVYHHKGHYKVILDKNLFKNILINLLSNAIKYSPNGGEIQLRTEVSANEVIVEVEDKGIGIPESEIPMMFQRFFRAKNSSNIQGTGLGLTIVKKYLDLMGGTIELESEENKGTTFTVKIPQNE